MSCDKVVQIEGSLTCVKMAYPASKNVDHYLAICQNVFLSLSLMLGALWILSVGWSLSALDNVPHWMSPKATCPVTQRKSDLRYAKMSSCEVSVGHGTFRQCFQI